MDQVEKTYSSVVSVAASSLGLLLLVTLQRINHNNTHTGPITHRPDSDGLDNSGTYLGSTADICDEDPSF